MSQFKPQPSAFCTSCGAALGSQDQFCAACGTRVRGLEADASDGPSQSRGTALEKLLRHLRQDGARPNRNAIAGTALGLLLVGGFAVFSLLNPSGPTLHLGPPPAFSDPFGAGSGAQTAEVQAAARAADPAKAQYDNPAVGGQQPPQSPPPTGTGLPAAAQPSRAAPSPGDTGQPRPVPSIIGNLPGSVTWSGGSLAQFIDAAKQAGCTATAFITRSGRDDLYVQLNDGRWEGLQAWQQAFGRSAVAASDPPDIPPLTMPSSQPIAVSCAGPIPSTNSVSSLRALASSTDSIIFAIDYGYSGTPAGGIVINAHPVSADGTPFGGQGPQTVRTPGSRTAFVRVGDDRQSTGGRMIPSNALRVCIYSLTANTDIGCRDFPFAKTWGQFP